MGCLSPWAGKFLHQELWVDASVFKTPHLLTFLSYQELKFTFQRWETTSFLACIGGNLSPRKGSKL